MFGFAAFFLLSAILNTAFGVSNGNVLLGLGAVSIIFIISVRFHLVKSDRR